mgnify:CR=1 FL=1
MTSLAIGDYLPYFSLRSQEGKARRIELYAGKKVAIFLLSPDVDTMREVLETRLAKKALLETLDMHCVFIVWGEPDVVATCHEASRATLSFWADCDGAVHRLLGREEVQGPPVCILTDENLKIAHRIEAFSPAEDLQPMLDFAAEEMQRPPPAVARMHAPVMIIPDALSPKMCERVRAYWRDGRQYAGNLDTGKGKRVNTKRKIRTDADVTDRDMLRDLDRALGKSVFPEIKKVGSFTVSHREYYKIGCYAAEDKGHYLQHRDTSALALANRRYSLSVALSDSYQGGGLVFPEYCDDFYRLPAGSALVFPSTLFHRIEPVTYGQRHVLVTFLYGEEEAAFRSDHRRRTEKSDNTEEKRILGAPDLSGLTLSRIYTQTAKDIEAPDGSA